MAGGEQRTVAYLKDGAYFGETALLSAKQRNATIIAMGKVEVIQVMKDDFLRAGEPGREIRGSAGGG